MAKPSGLTRRKPFREPYPRFLIVCEGLVTEKGYFENFRHTERCLIKLEISAERAPITLVRRAIELKKDADRKAKRDSNERFEHVWCVCDTDDHLHIQDAKQQARDNGIDVAISNPCFELWLFLHFEVQKAHIHRTELRRKLKTHVPGYDKEVPFAKIHPNYENALSRARDLSVWPSKRGEPDSNPSTNVHVLTEQLRSFRLKLS